MRQRSRNKKRNRRRKSSTASTRSSRTRKTLSEEEENSTPKQKKRSKPKEERQYVEEQYSQEGEKLLHDEQQNEEKQYRQEREDKQHKDVKQCEGPGLMNSVELNQNSQEGDQQRDCFSFIRGLDDARCGTPVMNQGQCGSGWSFSTRQGSTSTYFVMKTIDGDPGLVPREAQQL